MDSRQRQSRPPTAPRLARPEESEADLPYRALFAGHPDPIWVIEAGTLRFLEVNAAAARVEAQTRAWFLRRKLGDVWSEPSLEDLIAQPKAARDRPDRRSIVRRLERRGRPTVDLEVRVEPVRFRGGPAWLLAFRQLNQARAAEPRSSWLQRCDELISRAAVRLLESHEPRALMEELCREVMLLLGADVFVNFLADPEARQLRLNAHAGFRPGETRAFERLEYGAAVGGHVARTGRSTCCAQLDQSSTRRTALLRSLGLKAYCTLPLLVEGRLLGTLSFGSRSQSRFKPAQRGLMKRVAHLAASALHRIRTEEQAQVIRAKLEAALESMTDAVFISDVDGRFVEFNEAFATFHRFASKRECARTLAEYPKFIDVYFPDGSLVPLDQWAVPRALRGETVVNAEYHLRRRDTGQAWVGSYNFAPIRDPHGKIVGSVVVGRDITASKRAEEAIRESAARLRTVMDTVLVGFITIDESGTIQDVNRGTGTMFGYEPGELVGRNVNVLMPSPDRERHDGYLSQYRRTGRKRIIGNGREVMALRKDGSPFPVELAVAELVVGGRRLFVGTLSDVSQRRRLETEVVAAFERAQQELGADLHDGLGQHLHGIKYLASDLAERLARRKAPEGGEVRRFVAMIDQAIDQARSIARGLTPVEALPEGLEWGLRRLARELGALHRASVRFQCPNPVRVGNPMVARHLYRIAQEAAANSLRHSQCSRLVISLASTPENVVVGVRDNGVGMGPRGVGMGLHVMQYRANAMRASLVVHSTPGRGTEVACTVPGWAANSDPTPEAPGRSKPVS